jgi:hypothetical protein
LTLYAWLRDLHTGLAYLLFATFLAHFGAALYHGVIRRDGKLAARVDGSSFAPVQLGDLIERELEKTYAP